MLRVGIWTHGIITKCRYRWRIPDSVTCRHRLSPAGSDLSVLLLFLCLFELSASKCCCCCCEKWNFGPVLEWEHLTVTRTEMSFESDCLLYVINTQYSRLRNDLWSDFHGWLLWMLYQRFSFCWQQGVVLWATSSFWVAVKGRLKITFAYSFAKSVNTNRTQKYILTVDGWTKKQYIVMDHILRIVDVSMTVMGSCVFVTKATVKCILRHELTPLPQCLGWLSLGKT